jgi:archaellum biogenesis ATPase FlaH
MKFKLEVFQVGQLLTAQFPASDSMIGGNLLDRSGAMLISGPQKIGKSLFASQLALALGDRAPFLGFAPSNSEYRTLILQAEVSAKRLQERFLKQTRLFGTSALGNVLSASVYSSIKIDSDEGQGTVQSLVDQYKPDLVIVDPLANFHRGDENVAQDVLRVTTFLDDIRAQGPAVALVHHHGKASAERANVGHKARGSSALPGWYDSHLSLEKAGETVRLRFELRHDETPEDMILRLNPNTLLFEAQSDEAAQLTLVVSAIRELGASTAEAVGEYCHRSRQWASDWLNDASDREMLQRSGNRPVIFALPGQPAETRVDFTAGGVVVSTNTGQRVEVNGEEIIGGGGVFMNTN